MALPLWGRNNDDIVQRLSSVATFKIITKVRNEDAMISDWFEHHAALVGAENLIIADNRSDSSAFIDKLENLSAHSIVFQFDGFHNDFHDRVKFAEFYEAINRSCQFYICLDADERLVWIDNGRWRKDRTLIDHLAATTNRRALPTVLIDNFAKSRERFQYINTPGFTSEIIKWGKPIISTSIHLAGGSKIHNCQFNSSIFDLQSPMRAVVLHLCRLDPMQRRLANREKLLSRKIIPAEASLEDLEKIDTSKLPYDPVAVRCLNEIANLNALERGDPGITWGPSDPRYSILFRADGELSYGSDAIEQSFTLLLEAGARELPLLSQARQGSLPQQVPVRTVPLLDQALRKAEAGDTATAELLLHRGLVDHPELVDIHGDPTFRKELMRLLLSIQRWEAAASLIPPPNGPGPAGWHHILFARALDAAGRTDEARLHWQAFAQTRPWHPEARAALSVDHTQP